MKLMASTPAQSPRDSPATSSTCSASASSSFFHQHPRSGRRKRTTTRTPSSSLSFLRPNADKTRFPSPSLFFGTTPPTTLFRSRSCDNLQGTTRGFSQIRRTVSSDADFFFLFANKDGDEEEEPTYQNKTTSTSSNDDVSSRRSDWEKMTDKRRFQNVNMVVVESVGGEEEEGEGGILKVVEEEEFGGVSDYCSAKRAFGSMVFIIRELQSHSMGLREILFYEDLQGILCRVQSDMQASFCWLFQKIFSSTPTLMLSVMLLLANFTVHSMAHSLPAVVTATTNTTSESEPEGSSASNIIVEIQKKEKRGDERTRSGDLLTSLQREMEISSSWERTVEEAKRLQAETRHEALMDREVLVQLVSPVTVEVEPDEDYGEYSRLELMYLSAVKEDPCNTLFLSNYAQFLYQVRHDHDRAEHYFKRAAEVIPADAEALSRYASFMWMAKNDLAAAEETYLEAIDADPGNTSHAASYAHFLWNTGGDDTCFPLEDDDAQDQGHRPHQ